MGVMGHIMGVSHLAQVGRSCQFWPWAVRANFGPGPLWPILALDRSGQFWPWAVRANFGPGPFGPILALGRSGELALGRSGPFRLTHTCVSLPADSYLCQPHGRPIYLSKIGPNMIPKNPPKSKNGLKWSGNGGFGLKLGNGAKSI